MFLTRTLGNRKAREIRANIDIQLDLWEIVIHTGLVGDALVEGRSREGRVERGKEEEEDCLVHSFHITLLLGKLQQEVCRATNREEGVGVSSPRGCLHKDQATSCRRPPVETPRHAFTPHGNSHVCGL